MFYEIRNELVETDGKHIDPEVLTVGCVSSEELLSCGKRFGFDEETILASQTMNPIYQTGVDVHGDYTFATLRIINRDGHDDAVSLYIKHNFLLIVDIDDTDSSTINSFFSAIRKYPCAKIYEERFLSCFVESLLSGSRTVSEEIRNQLTEMEESIVHGDDDAQLNVELLNVKRRIGRYYSFYGQIMDIAETLSDNENEILDEDHLIYISNLISKLTRLRDDMTLMLTIADHIQDAYASLLDQRMNSTMKTLTILTTIFFPLTIIVGWYGMNFKYMPELSWRFGYLFVTLLSVAVVVLFVIIGKKKKWF